MASDKINCFVAKGRGHLHVFLQTIALKSRFGNFAAIFIMRLSIQLIRPALIFLGGRANKNPFSSQSRNLFLHPLSVKAHGTTMLRWDPRRQYKQELPSPFSKILRLK
jgi:hypothetical protein